MNTPRPWRKSEGVMNVSGRRYQEMVVLIGNRQRARDGVRAMRLSARRFVMPIGMKEIDSHDADLATPPPVLAREVKDILLVDPDVDGAYARLSPP